MTCLGYYCVGAKSPCAWAQRLCKMTHQKMSLSRLQCRWREQDRAAVCSLSSQLGAPGARGAGFTQRGVTLKSKEQTQLINMRGRDWPRLLIQSNMWRRGGGCGWSVCVQISERLCDIKVGQPAWCSWNDSVRPWEAGTVGCWKTGLTWTSFRQHEGELYVASLAAGSSGSFLHFPLSSRGPRSVNDPWFGSNLKGRSYVFYQT